MRERKQGGREGGRELGSSRIMVTLKFTGIKTGHFRAYFA